MILGARLDKNSFPGMVHRLIGAREVMVSLSFIIVLFLTACSIIPWPYGLMYNTAEIITTVNTGKSFSEHAASKVTKKDCNWLRMLYGWQPCVNHEEYLTYLISMNCKIYSWNFLNLPYCRRADNINKRNI